MSPNPSNTLTQRLTPASASLSAKSTTFDPWLVWVAFRRNWYWATPLGVIFGLIGSYAVFQSFVPIYQASHLLEANRDYVVFQGINQGPSELIQNERPLIENHLVLAPVLSDAEICKAPSLTDPLKRESTIRKNLTISDAGSRTLLRISYKDSDPKAAAAVCNAIARSYLRQRQYFDSRRIDDLNTWLQPAVGTWQNEVEEHRKRIVELSKQNKGFDPFREASKVNSDTDYLTSLRDELSQLKSTEAVLEAELAMLNQANKTRSTILPDSLELDQMALMQPEVLKINQKLSDKNEEMRQMERNGVASLRQSHFNELKAAAERLEGELAAAKEAVKPVLIDRWKRRSEEQIAMDSQLRMEAKTTELQNVQNRRKVYEENYKTEESRLSQFAGETAELYFEQQKYLQAQSILVKLNERLASIRTESNKAMTIRSLAEALPPSVPVESIPWKKIFAVGGMAFALPFGLSLLWELKSKRVTSSESLENGRNVPIIGEVAKLPSGNRVGKQQRVYEESVEGVRANLMFSKNIENVQTIVVASSMSGEGKSSLASHLALSLARATGKPILLIDADLRSPDQHQLFGVDLGEGLASVLAGKKNLNEAVDRSMGDRLHLLTAGKLESNPYRIASADRIRKVLQEAKQQYRYVVIDTAPVLAASETLAFSAESDATIVCVMRDLSRQDQLKRCLNRLEAAGANVVGTIFNGVPTTSYYYRYGDYKYHLPSKK